MNLFVKEEGINNTIFFSENGLDINNHIQGSYSTSEDIAKIITYFCAEFPQRAVETTKVTKSICSNKKCHLAENTNILLEKYPEIIFSKTGYTKKSGGALAVVLNINGEKYTVVILGSTKQGRFEDLEKIIKFLKAQK
jgi:D-alanyl-D-alanine carboxypeptidase